RDALQAVAHADFADDDVDGHGFLPPEPARARQTNQPVMLGLVPSIHVLRADWKKEGVDAPDEPEDDEDYTASAQRRP
ncbi:MAG TPA: hypothetical protein VMB81_02480, partial [Candidatus Sulfotelmatobacter sp.]|nr:hypothetical protein [Candidatus Sulfotelmatobacter sp.]